MVGQSPVKGTRRLAQSRPPPPSSSQATKIPARPIVAAITTRTHAPRVGPSRRLSLAGLPMRGACHAPAVWRSRRSELPIFGESPRLRARPDFCPGQGDCDAAGGHACAGQYSPDRLTAPEHRQGFLEHLTPQQIVSVVIVAHTSALVLTSAGLSCTPIMPYDLEINHGAHLGQERLRLRQAGA
jgi:hypothetical protein